MKQVKKEEKLFYKQLGQFLHILESEHAHKRLVNRTGCLSKVTDMFSTAMLSNYRSGRTKISIFKLSKMLEVYDIDSHKFIDDFAKYIEDQNVEGVV